jgi:hypothetical protein
VPELEQSPELRNLLAQVREDVEAAEPYHRSCRDKWERQYGLYRSYQAAKSAYQSASERDRDPVIGDMQRAFGAELFIPYCFWTVETIVPRLLSNQPRMLVQPREPAADENVENMRHLIDAQQEQINYALKLQDPAKQGLMYGLGVTKTFWRRDKKKKPVLQPKRLGKGYTTKDVEFLTFDDPDVEAVDVFDFYFDPFAAEIEAADFAMHRTWRNNRYVRRMIESREWDAVTEKDLPALESMGPAANRYDSTWASRMAAGGHTDFRSRAESLHEVWEYHNGERVITVLDNAAVVKEIPNPYWHGRLPFQVYRPTKVPNELVGIGEIEPIEHLQAEMNTLRQQRRDNATLVLQKAFAYAEGFIDVNKVRFGPAAMIPVQGDPRELLMPIQVGDIPNSGYQEEANLAADIERVTGISDTIIGRESRSDQTATEAQLITSAANVRIQNKTARVEWELAAPACNQWIELNQQHIQERELRLEATPEPGDAERRWSWVQLTPGELAGHMVAVPVGGATAPDNVAQMRADARDLFTMFGQDPTIEPHRLRRELLRLLGIKQPESWLVSPPGPPIPPEALDYLVENGVAPELIDQALAATEAQSVAAGQLPPEEQPAPVVGGVGYTPGTGEAPPGMGLEAQNGTMQNGAVPADAEPLEGEPVEDNYDAHGEQMAAMTSALGELAASLAQQPPPVVNVDARTEPGAVVVNGAPVNVDARTEPGAVVVQHNESERPSEYDVIGKDGKRLRTYKAK